MTGRNPIRLNVPNHGHYLRPHETTIAEALKTNGYLTAHFGKWHIGMTFFDKEGAAINKNGLEAVRRVDYSRPVPDGPIHRGFHHFFGTVSCPTTDWLYAYMEGDRIPVPPTDVIDKTNLPKHPYANDNRSGLIAPNFDVEEVDLVFLENQGYMCVLLVFFYFSIFFLLFPLSQKFLFLHLNYQY